MARNGLGTYSLPAGQPVVTNTSISSTVFNTLTSDLATALTQSVCTDGQSTMTGNLNLGTKKVTNMGDGSLTTDGCTYGQMTTATSGITTSLTTTFNALIPGQNILVNPDFYVAQRGTTYALTTTAAYGSIDNWFALQASSAAGIFNQVADSAGNGRIYVAKLGRNNAATNTGVITMGQALETDLSKRLAGKTVVFSIYAKAGANLSSTSNAITFSVKTGTGTDQSSASLSTGGWTGIATPVTSSPNVTTSWVRYSATGTISSSATQIGVLISYTPSGTAGADDNLYIGDVQLEEVFNSNTSPTTFYRPLPEENLYRCKRYYQRFNASCQGYAYAGSIPFGINVMAQVPMRGTISPVQVSTNLMFADSNVLTSTSSYVVNGDYIYAYRGASVAGFTTFSEKFSSSNEL
ncbi:hypothetical protein UFOVP671_56 [uncultured Caudovirales phage]|uniref:Uncharacterized protein n=1 Tax=uncultured Caudovirales phage TaxID=2100421 RepID=A0A6J5NM04_9CAUD|nr:hypothetical protein UFOVP671_56 [uncultured Caudovirales phage]